MNAAHATPAIEPRIEQPPMEGRFPLRSVLVVAPNATAADAILRSLQRHRICRYLAWVLDAEAAVRRAASERFNLVLIIGREPVVTHLTTRRLRSCIGGVRLLVAMEASFTPAQIDSIAAAGAGGLIDCRGGLDQIPAATVMVAGGHDIFPHRIGSEINGGLAEPGSMPEPEALSDREAEILRAVANGMTSRLVAESLNLSVHTVEKYLSVAYRKLQATNRMQACNTARYWGLI